MRPFRRAPLFNFSAIAIASLCIFISTSCTQTATKISDTANGRPGEIRVFYPKAWEDSIQTIFASTQFAVDSNLVRFEENRQAKDPQYFESLYNLELHLDDNMVASDPTTNKPLQQHALIWAIDPTSKLVGCQRLLGKEKSIIIDTTIDKIECTWIRDVWAMKQIVLWIHDTHAGGENLSELWFKKHQEYLFVTTKQIEIEIGDQSQSNPGKHAALEQNQYSDSLSGVIAKKYNIQLCLNASLKLAAATTDFVWLRHENSQFHSNLMINIYPLLKTEIPLDSLIATRDLFTRKHQKTAEGTWVEVSHSGVFPRRFRKTVEGGKIVYYLFGWYTELNTDRRGPFVRKIVLDEKNHRCVAFDGFLFAPNQPRMSLMRELEIMVNYSFIR